MTWQLHGYNKVQEICSKNILGGFMIAVTKFLFLSSFQNTYSNTQLAS
jgi:hypothetical protein